MGQRGYKAYYTIINHSFGEGLIQTEGENILIIMVPTTPENNNVKRELSDVLLSNNQVKTITNTIT